MHEVHPKELSFNTKTAVERLKKGHIFKSGTNTETVCLKHFESVPMLHHFAPPFYVDKNMFLYSEKHVTTSVNIHRNVFFPPVNWQNKAQLYKCVSVQSALSLVHSLTNSHRETELQLHFRVKKSHEKDQKWIKK